MLDLHSIWMQAVTLTARLRNSCILQHIQQQPSTLKLFVLIQSGFFFQMLINAEALASNIIKNVTIHHKTMQKEGIYRRSAAKSKNIPFVEVDF